jgi:hypothetical protein
MRPAVLTPSPRSPRPPPRRELRTPTLPGLCELRGAAEREASGASGRRGDEWRPMPADELLSALAACAPRRRRAARRGRGSAGRARGRRSARPSCCRRPRTTSTADSRRRRGPRPGAGAGRARGNRLVGVGDGGAVAAAGMDGSARGRMAASRSSAVAPDRGKRRTGIEPASSPWKGEALPLSYRRARSWPSDSPLTSTVCRNDGAACILSGRGSGSRLVVVESKGRGEWRSLVAHPAGGRAVAGSNPVSPIHKSPANEPSSAHR